MGIDWSRRLYKDQTRRLLLSRIPKDKEISYLGLPGAQAIFEKELIKNHNVCSLELVEKESNLISTIKKSIKNLPSDKTILRRALIEDVLCHPVVEPNVIWLDYCGPFNHSRLSAVIQSCRFAKKSRGVAALTLAACRESSENKSLLELWAGQSYRSSIILQVRNYLSRHSAASLTGLSKTLSVTQKVLTPILRKEAGDEGLWPFYPYAERSPVWAASMKSAKEYLLSLGSLDQGLPTSIFRRIRAVSRMVSNEVGPVRITAQGYVDHTAMIFFIFDFTSDLVRNQLEILPYLKG